MTVKLAGKLPKDWNANGLDDRIFPTLVQDPRRSHIAVVVFDTAKITKDIENYETIPTLRIQAIEVVTGDDAGRLRAMLQRAHEERTGNLELPAEWESVLADMASPVLPGTEPGR